MWDELGTSLGKIDAMGPSDSGFCKSSLIWLLPARDVSCGICDCPEMISRVCTHSPNVAGDSVAAIVSVWDFTTARSLNSTVLYFKSLSCRESATYPHPGCVSLSSLICICRELSMQCCLVLEIVPITQPALLTLLSFPSSVSSSSPSVSSPSCLSSEPGRLLTLSPRAFNVFSMVSSGFLVVDGVFSAFPILSCSCMIIVSVSWTRFLGTAVALSTLSSIHLSFSSLLNKCVSCLFTAENFFLDRLLRNTPNARTLSASKPLLPSLAWWCRRVDCLVRLPYLPGRRGETFFFRALTIVSCVDYVVGGDVGGCKIWTTWRRAAYIMSRLVGLINLHKAKSAFWPSLHWEESC